RSRVRERWCRRRSSWLLHPRSALHSSADSCVGAAAADVAVHRVIDLGVGGLRRLRKQRRGLHDLPALAISALWYVQALPRDLARMRTIGAQSFDGGDPLPGRRLHRRGAATDRFAVEVYGARAAESDPAAEFSAGEFQLIAQKPEERHIAIPV